MAWIGDHIGYERRQATLARFMMGQMLGVIGGQFVGGVFADHLGWRWTFGFLAVTFLAASAALWTSAIGRGSVPSSPRTEASARQVAAIVRAKWPRAIFATVFFEGMAVFGALAFIPSHLHHRFGISLTLASRGTAVTMFASFFFLGQSAGVFFASALVETAVTPAVFGGAALLVAALAAAFAPALRRHRRTAMQH